MVDVLPKLRDDGDKWRKLPKSTFECQRNDSVGRNRRIDGERSTSGVMPNNNPRGESSRRGKYVPKGRHHTTTAGSPWVVSGQKPNRFRKPREHGSAAPASSKVTGEQLAHFKIYPTVFPDPLRRPFHGRCCTCMPHSVNGFVSDTTTKLGLHNLLLVPQSNCDQHFLTRQCCYIFHCLHVKANFRYPAIPNQLILKDDRLKSAIDQSMTEELEERGLGESVNKKFYSAALARHKARANRLLNAMKAALSATLIRITGYVLFKVFSKLLMSVTVHRGQLEMVEHAAKKNTPLIFLPLHRSHVDYLFVTWVLFNLQIPAPIVAAGDNLRMPIFGWLLRGLGGFFIKRRLESTKDKKDIVYRAVLQTYMTHALQAGYNLEFFIEGGRTRTGKPCIPKGGILSVIVDAYINGTLEDALIVPIAINYERLLDGNFIQEQLGQGKVPESFWGAVTAIAKVLSTNYGHTRIDFGQPFSLREYVQSSKVSPLRMSHARQSFTTPPVSPSPSSGSESPTYNSPFPIPLDTSTPGVYLGHHRSLSTPPSSDHLPLKKTSSNLSGQLQCLVDQGNRSLIGAASSSSLFGTDVTDEYRQLVKSLAMHIVYDAEGCQAIMSTNAVAWLLSFAYRQGCSLETLSKALDTLRETLQGRGRDVGFTGTSTDVILHAVKLLGAGLVHTEVKENQSDIGINKTENGIFIKPVTMLPNVVELNYYANALLPIFAADAIVATALVSISDCNLWSYQDCSIDIIFSHDKLLQRAKRLSDILGNEFVLVPSCKLVEDKLSDTINQFVTLGLLNTHGGNEKRRWTRGSDSDDDNSLGTQWYEVVPSRSNLEVLATWISMLSPILSAYYCTAVNLRTLVNKQIPDKQFINETQNMIKLWLEKDILQYSESIAADPVRNAVKLFEANGILESYIHNSLRVLYLSRDYDSEDRLSPVINEINSYRQ